MPSITFFLIDSQRSRVYTSKEKVKNFKNKSIPSIEEGIIVSVRSNRKK